MNADERCAVEFAINHPAEAALRLESIRTNDAVGFLKLLKQEQAANILSVMHAAVAAECLATMDPAAAAGLAGLVPLDRATRIIREMPESQSTVLREHFKPEFARRLDRVMRYPLFTVGSLMDPAVFSVTDDMTAGEAVRTLKRAPTNVYYYVYVVTRNGLLVGVLDVRELLEATPTSPLTEILHREPVRLSPLTDLTTASTLSAWRTLDALPVVDNENKLLGILRYRTLRQQELDSGREIKLEELGITLVRLGEMYWSTLGVMLAATVSLAGATIQTGASTEASE